MATWCAHRHPMHSLLLWSRGVLDLLDWGSSEPRHARAGADGGGGGDARLYDTRGDRCGEARACDGMWLRCAMANDRSQVSQSVSGTQPLPPGVGSPGQSVSQSVSPSVVQSPYHWALGRTLARAHRPMRGWSCHPPLTVTGSPVIRVTGGCHDHLGCHRRMSPGDVTWGINHR